MQLATFFILAMFVLVFFVLPIGGVVLFVQLRNKARLAMLEGPWSALAQQFGGRLEGERVVIRRDAYQMVLVLQGVSVMQAVGSPYYADGGTYTEARLYVDPQSGLTLVDQPFALRPAQVVHVLGETAFAQLPAHARVVVGPREARVVLAGAIGDAHALGAAFAGLQALAESARARGASVAA
jgi:hypothetical protein